MPVWKVQEDDEIVELTEEKLRKQLRKGDLTGVELARPEGDSDWKPLHDWPVFKEEVPHDGDVHALMTRRIALPLMSHASVFVATGIAMGWPSWMVWWGMGLGAHAVGTIPKLITVWKRSPPSLGDRRRIGMIAAGGIAAILAMIIAGGATVSAPLLGLAIAAVVAALTFTTVRSLRRADPQSGAAPAAKGVEAKTAAAPADAYLAELETAFTALEKQAAELGKTGELGDLPAIKKAATSLHKRRLGLLPLCDPQMRARLDKEQDEAIAAEEKADVPMTKDVYRQQALALQQRIDAIDEASAMAARLEARERTLLHQVENLRLQLARSGVEETATPSLAGDIERINRELAAETEVAEVSRGRLGTAAIPKKTM